MHKAPPIPAAFLLKGTFSQCSLHSHLFFRLSSRLSNSLSRLQLFLTCKAPPLLAANQSGQLLCLPLSDLPRLSHHENAPAPSLLPRASVPVPILEKSQNVFPCSYYGWAAAGSFASLFNVFLVFSTMKRPYQSILSTIFT